MKKKYLGRILSIGINEKGPYVAYRLSSRSFPNRMVQHHTNDNSVSIVPKPGYERDIYSNPYIVYNCIRFIEDTAIVSNGSHTDVIIDKIESGMNSRDAIAYSLLTLGYEQDNYNTPRIAGAMTPDGEGYIGIITHEKIVVEKLEKNQSYYISTYEDIYPMPVDFEAGTAAESSKYIINGGVFGYFTNAVGSTSAVYENGEWNIDVINLNRTMD